MEEYRCCGNCEHWERLPLGMLQGGCHAAVKVLAERGIVVTETPITEEQSHCGLWQHPYVIENGKYVPADLRQVLEA